MSNIGENSVKVENSEAISETLDDDPFMRHEKSKIDIKQGSEGKRLGELRLVQCGMPGRMPLADSERPIAPTPGASNWVQTGPTATPKGQTHSPTLALVTGRVTSIIIDQTDSNIIYVGAAQGGVWKTVNGGKSWVAKTDHEISLAIGALAMDPTNHLIIYAGTGEGNFSGDSYYGNGILKTIDGGNSWTTLAASTFSMSRFCRLAVNPTTPTTIFVRCGFWLN